MASTFGSPRSICLSKKYRFSILSGVQPFQFEPTYPPGQEPIDLEEESESGDTNQRDARGRISSTVWCSWEEYKAMATEEQCFCCQELAELNQSLMNQASFSFRLLLFPRCIH